MSPSLTDDALDVQAELLGYYLTDMGAAYAASEFELAAESMKLEPIDPFRSSAQVAREDGPRIFRELLTGAATFAVSEDICSVLQAAAPKIEMFPLHVTDVPSLSGFVWLEYGIVIHDDTADRKPIVVRAFAWRSMLDPRDEVGLVLILFTDPTDDRDHASDTGELMPEFLRAEAEARRLQPDVKLWPPRSLWSMIGGLWAYGDTPVNPSESFKLLSAFLRFIGEPWIAEAQGHGTRPSRRRAERAGITPPEGSLPGVRVIRLRKQQTAPGSRENASGRHLTVRTLVGSAEGGFWRNTWYPKAGVHRPQWIWPYERGPADAPLVVHEAVFRVDR